MSRSKRKPYHNIACMARGAMKKWKKQCNRSLRRVSVEEELYAVKKMIDRWSAPDDGRSCSDDNKDARK